MGDSPNDVHIGTVPLHGTRSGFTQLGYSATPLDSTPIRFLVGETVEVLRVEASGAVWMKGAEVAHSRLLYAALRAFAVQATNPPHTFTFTTPSAPEPGDILFSSPEGEHVRFTSSTVYVHGKESTPFYAYHALCEWAADALRSFSHPLPPHQGSS